MTARRVFASVAAAVLVALIGVGPAPIPAAAAEPDGGATIELAIGVGGRGVRAGGWVPVEVTVAAERLVAGTLTVGIQGGAGSAEVVDLEVQGGTAKIVRVVLPPGETVTATLEPADGRRVVQRARVPVAPGLVVGVLGDTVPAAAPAISVAVTQQRALLVPVAVDWLDRSVRTLDAVDALVVAETDLAGLSAPARSTIVAATAAGLQLVVTATRPGPLELGLPWTAATEVVAASAGPALVAADDVWSAARGELDGVAHEAATAAEVIVAAVPAGTGRLSVVATELDEQDAAVWSEVLAPRASAPGGLGRHSEFGFLAGEALRTDDLQLPSLVWLAGFVVVYVLVVGPLNGVVLWRTGRRELAWLTVPAITVVFVALAFATSRGAQPPVALSATATVWTDGVGSELEAVLVRAPEGGARQVILPGRGWAATAGQLGRPGTIDRRGDATALTLPLESLEVGTVTAWRTTDEAAPLEVAAALSADGLDLDIVNVSGRELADVMIHAATVRQELDGTLAPDASRRVRLPLDAGMPSDGWPGDLPDPWRGHDGRLEAPKSLGALLAWDVLDREPGVVWVTATTGAPRGVDVEVEGGATEDAGSFLAVGVRPTVAGGTVPPHLVDRDLLLPAQGQGASHRPNLLEGPTGVLRFRLPAGGEVASLTTFFDGLGSEPFPRKLPARPEPDRVRPMPERMPPQPDRAVATICVEDDPDGDGRDRTLCHPETGIPPMFPPCPADAVSCTYGESSFEICRPDGSCEGAGVAHSTPLEPRPLPMPPDPGGELPSWELWDHIARGWVAAEAATVDGRITDPAPYVSPLGEVYARVTSPGFPVDLSGAGLGGTFRGAS